ncbi:MAG: type II toxin-antitoxin system RelE/ParE family toxin [Campylobacterales bacterium]|nr:type II toxin-antitoxin system RelE/ParE family toxin [Campylobacterales bacterium]
MAFELIYLEKAQSDLESILDFIAKDSPERAGEYVRFLQKEIGMLADFPKLGVTCRRKNVRRNCRILIIDNYLVFYKIDETAQSVTVGRVLHSSVNYKGKKLF